MTLKFKLSVAGHELIVTAQQVDKLITALKGCEVAETQWKGAGKGFYGSDQQYEVDFVAFNPGKHMAALSIVDQDEIDRHKTIIAMRKNQLIEE